MDDHPNLTIGIGASAGGVEAITRLISQLPRDLQATLIVATHRHPDADNVLTQVLDRVTDLQVANPVDGDKLECAVLYIGAPDERVRMDGPEFDVSEQAGKYARKHRIDDLFQSIAESAGANAVGVVLSGMLWDGTEGLSAIVAAGGRALVQSPHDSEFADMPTSALENVAVDFVGTPEQICERIVEIADERSCRPA